MNRLYGLFAMFMIIAFTAYPYTVQVTHQEKVKWNAASTHATTDADTSATNEIQTLEQVLEQGATSTRDMAVQSITTTHNATIGGDAVVTGDTDMGGDLDVAGCVFADRFEGFGTGYTGVGTTDPAAMLEVAGGEVYVNYSTGGLILKSPDGTCSRCTVNNSDVFSCTSITCPTAP